MAAQPDMAQKQTPKLEQCKDEEKTWIWIWPLSKIEVLGMGGFYFPWEKGQCRSRGTFWLCLGALWCRPTRSREVWPTKRGLPLFFKMDQLLVLLELCPLVRCRCLLPRANEFQGFSQDEILNQSLDHYCSFHTTHGFANHG